MELKQYSSAAYWTACFAFSCAPFLSFYFVILRNETWRLSFHSCWFMAYNVRQTPEVPPNVSNPIKLCAISPFCKENPIRILCFGSWVQLTGTLLQCSFLAAFFLFVLMTRIFLERMDALLAFILRWLEHYSNNILDECACFLGPNLIFARVPTFISQVQCILKFTFLIFIEYR